MSKSIRIALVLSAVTLCLGIAACGVVPSGTTNVKTIVPSSGPVSLDLGVDVSQTTADETLRKQYFAAGTQAVQVVLDRGGHLAVSVFFSRGLHPVNLLDADVPTPEEVGGVARAQEVVPIREAAEGALAEALGLAPRQPAVADALSGLGGEGTDVAGSVSAGLAATSGQPNPVVIRLTDGIDADWSNGLGAPPKALAERVEADLPGSKHYATVGLVGIGGNAAGLSSGATERLLVAWRIACKRIATRCYVAPAPDLSRLIAG
jgi:hypothetical protein